MKAWKYVGLLNVTNEVYVIFAESRPTSVRPTTSNLRYPIAEVTDSVTEMANRLDLEISLNLLYFWIVLLKNALREVSWEIKGKWLLKKRNPLKHLLTQTLPL